MPKIHLINMTTEIQNNKIPILSKILIEKIKYTLEKKEQVVLLQNRRSHSYIVKCENCNNNNLCLNHFQYDLQFYMANLQYQSDQLILFQIYLIINCSNFLYSFSLRFTFSQNFSIF